MYKHYNCPVPASERLELEQHHWILIIVYLGMVGWQGVTNSLSMANNNKSPWHPLEKHNTKVHLRLPSHCHFYLGTLTLVTLSIILPSEKQFKTKEEKKKRNKKRKKKKQHFESIAGTAHL